jgi:hypothetical protein
MNMRTWRHAELGISEGGVVWNQNIMITYSNSKEDTNNGKLKHMENTKSIQSWTNFAGVAIGNVWINHAFFQRVPRLGVLFKSFRSPNIDKKLASARIFLQSCKVMITEGVHQSIERNNPLTSESTSLKVCSFLLTCSFWGNSC